MYYAMVEYEKNLETIISSSIGGGADVNELTTVDGHVATPLHMACAKHLLINVEVLLQCGANPNMKDLDGFRPLHYLFLSSLNNLVEYNVTADTIRYLKKLATKTQVSGKLEEIKELLLKFGAKDAENHVFWADLYKLQSQEGRSPLILAVQLRHAPISFINPPSSERKRNTERLNLGMGT